MRLVNRNIKCNVNYMITEHLMQCFNYIKTDHLYNDNYIIKERLLLIL